MITPEQKEFMRYGRDIAICGVIIALLCSLVMLLSYNPASYYNMMAKEVRLAAAPHPRLFVIGGSGAGISIDSELIQEETGYNTLNMGVSAGLGLRFMFRSIEDELRDGDVVLYFMESTVVQQPLYADGAALFATLHPSPSYALTILRDVDVFTAHTIVDMVRKFPTYLQQQTRGLYIRKIESLIYEPEPTLSERLYNVYNFNAYGDVDSTVAGDKHLSTEEVLKSDIGRIGDRGTDPRTLSLLAEMIRSLNDRGVRVFVLWPAYAKVFYDQKLDPVQERNKEIVERLGRDNVIGNVDDFILNDELFLDHSSHLTSAGRDEYTRRLIPLLLPHLNAK